MMSAVAGATTTSRYPYESGGCTTVPPVVLPAEQAHRLVQKCEVAAVWSPTLASRSTQIAPAQPLPVPGSHKTAKLAAVAARLVAPPPHSGATPPATAAQWLCDAKVARA